MHYLFIYRKCVGRTVSHALEYSMSIGILTYYISSLVVCNNIAFQHFASSTVSQINSMPLKFTGMVMITSRSRKSKSSQKSYGYTFLGHKALKLCIRAFSNLFASAIAIALLLIEPYIIVQDYQTLCFFSSSDAYGIMLDSKIPLRKKVLQL